VSAEYTFSKPTQASITIVEGLGVEGDAHNGVTVKHRSRARRDPTQSNLRQVHLIHEELFEELSAKGFSVAAGELGENVTTSGIDLLGLPTGTRLHLGDDAVIEVTGLRDPCSQIDGLGDGLMKATLDYDADGNLIRKAGIMSIAIAGGVVHADDEVRAVLPAEPHVALGPV
jgi:MOSC domain-containing protein YiiM